MAVWAIINNADNKCENVVLLNEGVEWPTPEGFYRINIDGSSVGIDWTYNQSSGEWLPPIVPDPIEQQQPAGDLGPTVM